MKPTVLLALSFPPPFSGEESLGLTLKKALEEISPQDYRIVFFDISNKRSNKERGKLSFGNVGAVFRLIGRFVAVLRRARPAVIYIPLAQNRFGFAKYSFFIWIGSFFGSKIVSLLGGGEFHSFYQRESFIARKWILKTLRSIDRLIVQGETLKKQFEGLVPREKLRVVPLGVDCAFFKKGISTRGEKTSIDILYVGCLSKAKGVLDLLRAVPKVIAQVPNARFHLVGEILSKERNILSVGNGDIQLPSLQTLLADPAVSPYVRYHGIKIGEEKLALFHLADMVVLPSHSESFPFVLLEAAASGCALVATPVGANPEVYQEGKNILYVNAGNVDPLAEKIIRLSTDTALREAMGRRNEELVSSQFTHLHFGKKIHQILLECLGCPHHFIPKEADQ